MRRVQFFEFHEQPWFPSFLRDGITDALQFGINLLNSYGPIAPLLRDALGSSWNGTKLTQAGVGLADAGRDLSGGSISGRPVVDLCSGGGGPWLRLSRMLPGLEIWLTDKYPNVGAFEKVGASAEEGIHFYTGSVDAMAVPLELKGFRTMFTAFHHFPPEEARAILQNAVDAGEGIGIFEMPRRAASTMGLTFAFVFLLFLCTPWIRPFRWSRLFWTYVVPALPVVLLFDGWVSCLRTYRPAELRELVGQLAAGGYVWKMGEQGGGRAPITYLVGYPRGSGADD
jgi:hypothetical protein